MSRFSAAVNKIRGLSSSYFQHPAMLQAKAVASKLATNPYVLGGTAAGVGSGVGYDMATNDRSNWRSRMGSGIRGGLLGGLAGGGYAGVKSLGGMKSAMSTVRSKAMNYGARGVRSMAGAMDDLANFTGGAY